MARPMYTVQKGDCVKTVTSAESLELKTQGWVVLGKVGEEKKLTIEVQPTPVIETQEQIVLDPQYKPKIEQPKEELETKEVQEVQETQVVAEHKSETKTDKKTKSLKCPHCSATARTEKSYKRNHGDNCVRALKK